MLTNVVAPQIHFVQNARRKLYVCVCALQHYL